MKKLMNFEHANMDEHEVLQMDNSKLRYEIPILCWYFDSSWLSTSWLVYLIA